MQHSDHSSANNGQVFREWLKLFARCRIEDRLGSPFWDGPFKPAEYFYSIIYQVVHFDLIVRPTTGAVSQS